MRFENILLSLVGLLSDHWIFPEYFLSPLLIYKIVSFSRPPSPPQINGEPCERMSEDQLISLVEGEEEISVTYLRLSHSTCEASTTGILTVI